MTDLDLSRRAMAAGMRPKRGAVWVDTETGASVLLLEQTRLGRWRCWEYGEHEGLRHCDSDKMRPDLDDPGTRGHLLEQVRERLGDPFAYCGPVVTETHWKVWSWTVPGGEVASGPTEKAASVAALEAGK